MGCVENHYRDIGEPAWWLETDKAQQRPRSVAHEALTSIITVEQQETKIAGQTVYRNRTTVSSSLGLSSPLL
jgi:hypothetical protein